jgi:hypothetical protein
MFDVVDADDRNALLSAYFSGLITFLWSLGQKPFLSFCADAATAMYLSLNKLEKKGFLSLTIPSGMLTAKNLSRFQTERIT